MLNKRRAVVIESMENRVLFDASLLTETIVSSTLPAMTSDQAVLKGKVVVDVSNTSGVDEDEKVAFGIEISNGTLVPLSGAFGILSNKVLKLVLKNGQTKPFTFNVSITKGKLADGVDTVTALIANQLSAYSQSAPGPTLTVHAPIITLSETETFAKLADTVVAGAKVKGQPADKVVISNSGTDELTTPITVAVYATTDGVASDGTLVASVKKTVKINPGKIGSVTLPIPGVPKLADGTYSLITEVTQSDAVVTTTDPSTAPTVTIAAPGGGTTGPLFSDTIASPDATYTAVPLVGYLQTLTNLKMLITVKNTGSTTDGTVNVSLFASPSSTFDSSAVQVGGPLTFSNLGSIPTNGTRSFNASFNINQDFPGTADADGNTNDYIFIQVTDPAGNVTMASYPTAINFGGPIVG